MWSQPPTWLIVLIFAVTWVLITGRRLAILPIGRPAGALVGAVLMVLVGAIPPEVAYSEQVLSHETLGLLLGTMLLSGYLDEGGFFAAAAALVDRWAPSPRRLLVLVAVLPGALSALLVNDTVCVLLAPLVIRIVVERKLPAFPFILAFGCGTNVGCALTLVGNPQNMLVASQSGIPFTEFLLWMAAPVTGAMGAMILLLDRVFRAQLAASPGTRPPGATVPPLIEMWPGLLGLAAAAVGFVAGHSMAWSALGGATLAILLTRRDPRSAFSRVDFQLLVFFSALFVVVGALRHAGLTGRFFLAVEPLLAEGGLAAALHLAWVSVVGSQVFSNVPLVQVLGPPLGELPDARVLYLVLALSSTLAGNLTPIGSVANVIVLENARRHGIEVGFRQFTRHGILVTAITLATAMAILLAQAWVLGRLG